MLSTKTIEDEIITRLKDLPDDEKKELLEYIEDLRTKKSQKTLKLLKKTSGSWRGLVDTEKLKHDIYLGRLISTRTKVKF